MVRPKGLLVNEMEALRFTQGRLSRAGRREHPSLRSGHVVLGPFKAKAQPEAGASEPKAA